MNAKLHTDETPKPLARGCLTILKTKAEVEARFQPIEAFVTTIPANKANIAVRLDETFLYLQDT